MGVLEDALKANGKVLSSMEYEAITKLTFESQNSCNDVHYTLMAKLSAPLPEIRLKTLAVIKHLLTHGHPSFRDTLQKRHRPLQLCNNFRGPPDPVKGDSQYAEIRQLSQEIMNVMFEAAPIPAAAPTVFVSASPSEMARCKVALGAKSMDGVGSGGSGSGVSGGPPQEETPLQLALRATKGAAGSQVLASSAANPLAALTEPPRGVLGGLSTGGAAGAAAGVLGALSRLGNSIEATVAQHMPGVLPVFVASTATPGYEGVGSSTPSSSAGRSHSYDHHLDSTPVAARPGGGWYNSPPPPSSSASGRPRSPQNSSSSVASAGSGIVSVQVQPYSMSSITAPPTIRHEEPGEYERRLIEELTEPGGVRAAPPRDALQRFVQRCASLDRSTVVQCLIDRIDGAKGDPALAMACSKALHVLEALATAPAPLGAEVVKCMEPYAGELRDAEAACSQPIAKQKAQRLLALIGGADSGAPLVAAAAPAAAAKPAAPAAPGGLDGIFAGLSVTAPAPAAAPAAAAPAPSVMDIFSTISAPSKPAAAPAASPARPGAAVPPSKPAAPALAPASSSDLLSQLPANLFSAGAPAASATLLSSLASLPPYGSPAPTTMYPPSPAPAPVPGAAPGYGYPPPPPGAYGYPPPGAYPYPGYPPAGYGYPPPPSPAPAPSAAAGGASGASGATAGSSSGGSFDFVGEVDKFNFVAEAMQSGKLS